MEEHTAESLRDQGRPCALGRRLGCLREERRGPMLDSRGVKGATVRSVVAKRSRDGAGEG